MFISSHSESIWKWMQSPDQPMKNPQKTTLSLYDESCKTEFTPLVNSREPSIMVFNSLEMPREARGYSRSSMSVEKNTTDAHIINIDWAACVIASTMIFENGFFIASVSLMTEGKKLVAMQFDKWFFLLNIASIKTQNAAIIIDEIMHKAHKNQPIVELFRMPAPTKFITNAREGNVEKAMIISQSFFVILWLL